MDQKRAGLMPGSATEACMCFVLKNWLAVKVKEQRQGQ